MNLDDFIFPENVAPAALVGAHSSDMMKQKQERGEGDRSGHTTAAAIPIKSRKNPPSTQQPLVPQSVPVPPHQRQDEFGYVTRHHRKTSIDERRVSIFALSNSQVLCLYPNIYPHTPGYLYLAHSDLRIRHVISTLPPIRV